MNYQRIVGSILLILLLSSNIAGLGAAKAADRSTLQADASAAAPVSGHSSEPGESPKNASRELTLEMDCSYQNRAWMTDAYEGSSGSFHAERN